METKQKLQTLLSYYQLTRGVGHTEKMLSGAKTGGALIMVGNFTQALLIGHDRWPASRLVTWQGLDAGTNVLRGQCRPLCLDNSAIMDILKDALAEIDRLERIVTGRDLNGALQRRIRLREPLPLGDDEKRGGLVSPTHDGYHTTKLLEADEDET